MKTTPTSLVPFPRSERINAAALTRARFSLAMLAALALFSLAGRVAGQGTVPERLSFQGYIEDGSSTPLGQAAPANYDVVFRIFPTATGGISVRSEKQTVTFDKGNYSVLLGQGTEVLPEPFPDLSAVVLGANGSELYVETTVTINSAPAKILPRLRLLPTPYAFLAKKAATADTALNVNGSAIAVGSIPDNRLSANITSGPIADGRLSANVTGPILDSRLSANVALRNAPNTFMANQWMNANVGIGTPATPAGAPGKLLVNGGVRARGGAPGPGGFNDNGYAFSGNGGGTGSGMFSSAAGSVEFHTTAGEVMRLSNSQVGIGTGAPLAKLDVNGDIRATGITVNGPVTATTFNGTFNGEKPPVTFTIPTTQPGNLASSREVLVDTSALLGDADGGRIKVVARNHANKTVRTYSIEFYAEQETDFPTKPQTDGRYYWSVDSYGNEAGDQFIGRGGAFRVEVAPAPWDWVHVRNFSSNTATGQGDGAAFDFANRYKFYFLVNPNVTATITIYDR